MADREVQRRLAAILGADVAGYTRLMGRDFGEIIFLGHLVQCQWLKPGDHNAIEIDGLGATSAQFIP
jgi:2-keto-4-pentenoate hydratase